MGSSPENPNLLQNKNQQIDVEKLFKPLPNPPPPTLPTSSSPFPSPSGNLNSSPSFPTPAPTSSTPYLMPSSSYPPPTGPSYPFHPDFLPYPPSPLDHFQQQQQHQLLTNSACLMALLTPQNPPSSPSNSNNNLDFPQLSMSFPSPSSSSPSPSNSIPSVPPPTRLLSTKLPKGHHLIGDRVVYDIDARLQGEVQPQLEVTPITKYGSDPGLVLGRQIAVNRSYICYGLKLGNIRVLNINTALRALLRGHTQRVTDMAFFAEDVHLLASAGVDGRVFVWKIDEGPDEEDKPQITGKIVIAIHIEVGGESVHPRVCWHPHKQEILMVAIGGFILKVDNTKVGKGEVFLAEEPLKCSIDELIDGIQLVGKHDHEVTELSMCQWMTSRLASASIDGSVKIWADHKALPLAVFKPHDSNPVHSVTFLTAPHRPDHIVLITAGPLNREVKIWTSVGEEGWLLPSDTESWKCTQTLDIKSSSEPKIEDAFFNQVISLPRAGLLLLANAKKNAIYAVHIEYGPNPAATRMDYISEFTVTMPILSLTGTSDSLPDGENIVQVYCIQTLAIQQYALHLSQCLPPPIDNVELEKSDSTVSRAFDASASFEPPHGCKPTEISVVNATPMPPILSSSAEIGPVVSLPANLASSEVTSLLKVALSGVETMPSDFPSHVTAENIHTISPPLPLSPRLSRKLSGFRSPLNSDETNPPLTDHGNDQSAPEYSSDRRMDFVKDSMADVPSSDENLKKGDKSTAPSDISTVPNPPLVFKQPTHLVTPPLPLSPRLSRKLSGFRSPLNSDETNPPLTDHGNDQSAPEYSSDRRMDFVKDSMADVPSSDENLKKGDKSTAPSDISTVPNPPLVFKQPTHLVTPPLPLSPRLSRKLSGFRSPLNSDETNPPLTDHGNDQSAPEYSSDRRMDFVKDSMADVPSSDENLKKGDKSTAPSDISTVPNPPLVFKQPTHLVTPPLPLSPRLSRKLSGFRSPLNSDETNPPLTDHGNDQSAPEYSSDRRMDFVKDSMADVPSSDENLKKGDKSTAPSDISMVPNPPIVFKQSTHLVTPSELLSTVSSLSENTQISQDVNVVEAKVQDLAVNNDAKSPEVKVRVIGETGTSQRNEFDSQRDSHIMVAEKKEKSFSSQASDLGIQMARDCFVGTDDVDRSRQANDVSIIKAPNQPPNTSVEEVQDKMKDVPTKVGESETPVAVLPSPAPAPKGKRQKGKNAQVSGSSYPFPRPFNSTDSSNEPGGSSGAPSIEAALPRLLAMQAVLDQLMSTQKEMQKQMNVIASGSFSKEGKRLEGSLGRTMEKVIRANTDALCARFQEENTKQEKLEHDRMQQITNLITNHINKDLPAVLEKTLKKEIAVIGPAVALAITPIVEKTVSSSIMDSFQKGVGDKAVNQLEKSVSSKLEGTVTRQIQAQFQISGKQILQDALRSSLEASIIPAFEISCKAMFEQVDITLQKVLGKHTTAAQQQFEATHSPLAIALRDAINSASAITQTLSGELADGQRQLLAIAAAGANSKAVNPLVTQLSNEPLAGLPEMGEAPLDPKKELSRLIAECKFEEAFTEALHRRDVSIVSWLCSQVDLQRILSTVPLPLSQGVLLALLQQLSYDIANETPRKLTWMTDIAVSVNPADPAITVHVHPIFEQVYQILGHRRNLPTTSASDASSIRLLMHVINSVLMSCK